MYPSVWGLKTTHHAPSSICESSMSAGPLSAWPGAVSVHLLFMVQPAQWTSTNGIPALLFHCSQHQFILGVTLGLTLPASDRRTGTMIRCYTFAACLVSSLVASRLWFFTWMIHWDSVGQPALKLGLVVLKVRNISGIFSLRHWKLVISVCTTHGNVKTQSFPQKA